MRSVNLLISGYSVVYQNLSIQGGDKRRMGMVAHKLHYSYILSEPNFI